MKIMYVVPGPMNPQELERRGKRLQEWATPGVTVDMISTTEGPASVESMYEEYLGIPQTAKIIYQLEQAGYDAAVVGCAGDPGLDAFREITQNMVVVGPREAGMHAAAMLGHKFTVLTVTDSRIPRGFELVMISGLTPKLASVRAVNIPVLELANHREATLEKLVRIGREEMERYHSDAIVLGCMSMGFLGVAEDMQAILGIPVINPVKNALKTAEALVGCGLTHSKKAFALPPKLATGKVSSLDQLTIRKTEQD